MKKLNITRFVVAAALAIGCVAAGTPRPAFAVDTLTSKDAPDLTSVRAKIKVKDFAGAIAELTKLADTNQHADVYNLLAFSLRNIGDYAQARTYYAKALDFDPGHLGAHEYLGELYVKTGEMEKARAMLVKLDALCPKGCEEREDLDKAIKAAAATTPAPAKANGG